MGGSTDTPDATVVVVASGEIDFDTVGQLREALTAAGARSPAPALIIVDLHGVTFMDSTGLGALVFGLRTAERVGAQFAVRNPNPFIYGRLATSGLLEFLSCALPE